MTPLSSAIRKGIRLPNSADLGVYQSCPLGAAFLGSIASEREFAGFCVSLQAMSRESMYEQVQRGLMRAFPQLGQSVRAWPRLAEVLEHESVIPTMQRGSLIYRRQVHCSLWKAVTCLHDQKWDDVRIAELLERCGL